MTRTLIVMARAPAYGVGKTRLAAGIGRAAALRANRAMQAHTLRTVCDPRWRVRLAVAPDMALATRLPRVWPPRIVRVAQGGGDLGARLARALRAVKGPVAVIGTDCPQLRARDVAIAFQALGRARVAIGPAEDGGFWILAARRAYDVLPALAGVRWSSAHALADLAAGVKTPVERLRTLRDVDEAADWRALRAFLRQR
jgi:hypothetical protein